MRNLFVAFALALFAVIRSMGADIPATSAATSELSYDEIKKQFEKDETLEGVRISTFSASDVTVIYKGRYIVYRMSNLTEAQRKKIDSLIAAEKDRRKTQAVQDNDEAARAGMLREVDGVVYNLMKGAAGWVSLNGVVLQ